MRHFVERILSDLGLAVQFSILISTSTCAMAQAPATLDPAQAKAAFAQAREVSDRDGGRLWGMQLYGPILFVDQNTRAIVANEPDAEGQLHEANGVYIGTLPTNVMLADTPTEWAGKRWTMLRWPMPENRVIREVKYAHEMFHRIQPALRLNANDQPNLQLDTEQGRLWLQLEWRALAAALVEHGREQNQAIDDALAFRNQRHKLFPGSDKSEATLEIAEGVPEYTGLTTAVKDVNAARWIAIGKLADPDQSMTFVRSFAYTSGPPYGLLLDERMPGWRTRLNRESDLGALLASTRPKVKADSAMQRADTYGASTIRIAEADRATLAKAVQEGYRAKLVRGPTLTLAKVAHLRFSFNPSALVSLGDDGIVYPTFHASDAWGTLDVKDGALVPADFSKVSVAAPSDIAGSHIAGPGWTLDLAEGWHIVPGSVPGSYSVQGPP